MIGKKTTEATKRAWRKAWPEAVAVWNSYIKLREPVWCATDKQARKEGLEGSFAMIRLTDHLVVINLAQVYGLSVDEFALQILAHEIGHHVMIPANLHDNAKLLSRIRWGLAGIEERAPFVSNLYSDQLINHHLHQDKGLNMASVFRKLGPGISPSPVWTFMLRTYEHLWRLERCYLTGDHECSEEMDADAALGASLIRSYSREWLEGAGRYAALIYPYIVETEDYEAGKKSMVVFDDAAECGAGGSGIFGMAEMDDVEREAVVDPRLEAIGEAGDETENSDVQQGYSLIPDIRGGKEIRQRYREPGNYVDLMKQVDPEASENQLLIRYYRELATPHLVPFPTEMNNPVSEVLPEGTDIWAGGDSMEELDFIESTLVSPVIIPGYTTRKRLYGRTEDTSEDPVPLDLYIGIDCSGSMMNPAHNMSWPVLAGAVVCLSALRAGASVKAVLSGEPGRYMETNGFVLTDTEVMGVLVDYLGTGYAFGIPRLRDTFDELCKKKTHIMIITDDDIFSMLDAKAPDNTPGWEVSERAIHNARGGGTMVLHSSPEWRKEEAKRLEAQGWQVHYVTDESELLLFAREFADSHYDREAGL